MTATATAHVLPATQVPAPEGAYTLTGVKTLNGREGLAFTGKLRLGGTVVADVHNDGNGGMTFLRFTTRAAEDAFGVYVAAWTGTWGGDLALPYDTDAVVGALLDEALTVKALTAQVRKGRTPIRRNGQDKTLNYPLDAEVRAAAVKLLGADALLWDGTAWTPAA